MSKNIGIKVGLGQSRFKYSGRNYSPIETSVIERSTRTRPRDSDEMEDEGAYMEDDVNDYNSRLKTGFDMYSMD